MDEAGGVPHELACARSFGDAGSTATFGDAGSTATHSFGDAGSTATFGDARSTATYSFGDAGSTAAFGDARSTATYDEPAPASALPEAAAHYEVPPAFVSHDEPPPPDGVPHDLACSRSFGDAGSTAPYEAPALAPPEAAARYASSAAASTQREVSELASQTSTQRARAAELDEAHLLELFEAFSVVSSTGEYEMDSSCFSKFCKDARLLGAAVGRGLTRTDADLIFTRCKARGNYQKRIGWRAFRTLAVRQLAAHKRVNERALAAWLRAHATEGPRYAGTTRPDAGGARGPARFHNARATWTGVSAHCGGLTPSKDDHAITLATLCDRSPADARGVPLAAARDRGLYYTSAASGVGAPIRASSATRFDWAASHGPPPPSTVRSPPSAAPPPPPPAAPSGPSLAGQANRPGGVYERLSHPDTFTGIHGVHWRG